MKYAVALIIVFAIAVAQEKTIDPGGWTMAKWGMAETQIKTAFPKAKRLIVEGDPLRLLGVEHYEIAPVKYRVTFYFKKGGLNGVALRAEDGGAPPGVFADAAKDALLNALRDKYGEPRTETATPSGTESKLRKWQWLMPSTRITLAYRDDSDGKYRFAILTYSRRERSDQL